MPNFSTQAPYVESFPAKVLIVDDREDNLLVLRSILSELNVELIEAASGTEALELLLSHDVAVALIDVQMPEMDGFELAELMRGTNLTSHVPIIFITAGEFERNRVFRGYEAGAVDFLFKPLVPHILKGKVEIFAEIHRQRARLSAAVHLREELVAVVSHDLRTPLNSILMSSSLIGALSPEGDVMRATERIERSARRMESIINDLLDLSRTRLGGGMAVNPVPCNLGDIVRGTVEEVGSSRAQVLVESDGQLDGSWDSARLAQAVSNLLGNAIEHGDANRPVSVRIDGTDAKLVRLGVHNYGTIPAEHRAHLFQPFVSHGKDIARKGLGLGLYIVSQIAHAHRGEISVSTCNDSGTTFTLSIPRYCEASPSATA
jgi:two-component system, sensor histidine kinase and response regulator